MIVRGFVPHTPTHVNNLQEEAQTKVIKVLFILLPNCAVCKVCLLFISTSLLLLLEVLIYVRY